MALKFAKLTRTNIRSLSHKQEISEHGITFKRLSNGDGRFAVNIMVDGQRVHRVIGKESEGVTRLQAEDFIEKARTDARHGRLNLPKGRKFGFSFNEAAKKYLDRLSTGDGKNIKSKTFQFRLHLTPFFKDTPLTKITTFGIERYKKFRTEQGKAKNPTINRELATLSHLLNMAVEWSWIDHKPCRIKKFKEEQSKITYLTTEQIKQLIDAAKNDYHVAIYPFIVIGLETSMRKLEILSVAIKDIDIENRKIYIPKAKAGARSQPITKHLAEFLKPYINNADQNQTWLFPSDRSESGHMTCIERAFRRVVKNAELDVKTINRHTLRHTAITHLVQAGVDLPTVQRISGHKSLQMVVRYSHQNGKHIQSAMDALEKRYQLND
jgi:integrase